MKIGLLNGPSQYRIFLLAGVFGLSLSSFEGMAQAKKSGKKGKKGAKVEEVIPMPPPLAMNNAVDSVSYAIGVNVATYFKAQGLDSVNNDLLLKAFNDVFSSDSLWLNEMQANMTLQQKLQQFASEKLNKRKAEDAAFLAENKKREGVVETATGLQYEVLKAGTGTVFPTDASRVRVHYTGTLINGKKFDSSIDRGQPLDIGVGQVIKGWTEALKLMKVGDKFKIYIPSSIGYGDRGAGADIPGGAALIFEVELLEILQ